MNINFSSIIIAEDEPEIAEYYTEILKPYCNHIFHVTSGVELINKLIEVKGEIKVDLIILDQNMPLKSGSHTLDILPTLDPNFADIRVLFISGDPESSMSIGPGIPSETKNVCMLAKPFAMNDLQKCLKCCSINLDELCKNKESA